MAGMGIGKEASTERKTDQDRLSPSKCLSCLHFCCQSCLARVCKREKERRCGTCNVWLYTGKALASLFVTLPNQLAATRKSQSG